MLLPPPAALPDAPHPRVEVRTSASIRIEHPATVDREQWEKAPKASRREIVVLDEQGRPIVMRVIDYE